MARSVRGSKNHACADKFADKAEVMTLSPSAPAPSLTGKTPSPFLRFNKRDVWELRATCDTFPWYILLPRCFGASCRHIVLARIVTWTVVG